MFCAEKKLERLHTSVSETLELHWFDWIIIFILICGLFFIVKQMLGFFLTHIKYQL